MDKKDHHCVETRDANWDPTPPYPADLCCGRTPEGFPRPGALREPNLNGRIRVPGHSAGSTPTASGGQRRWGWNAEGPNKEDSASETHLAGPKNSVCRSEFWKTGAGAGVQPNPQIRASSASGPRGLACAHAPAEGALSRPTGHRAGAMSKGRAAVSADSDASSGRDLSSPCSKETWSSSRDGAAATDLQPYLQAK